MIDNKCTYLSEKDQQVIDEKLVIIVTEVCSSNQWLPIPLILCVQRYSHAKQILNASAEA